MAGLQFDISKANYFRGPYSHPNHVERCQQWDTSNGISPVDANPSTTVHILTEELRKNMD